MLLVSKPAYFPVFSEDATEFLLQFSNRRQRQIISLVRQLAAHPHVRSDYSLADDTGRAVEHLLIEDYIFAYWLDHGAREVRIVDIEDAS